MRLAILPATFAAAVLVAGCAGGDHQPPPSSSVPPSTRTPEPPAAVITYPLGSTTIERGVTLRLDRVVVPPNGPARLVMDIANQETSGPDLEFDPSRVVVRQGGRRISTNAGPSFVLTNGVSSQGFTVQMPGFRPGRPYTIDVAVVADTALRSVPAGWHQPLRLHWRYGVSSVSTS